MRAALPPEVHLHYAIKANPMPAVAQVTRTTFPFMGGVAVVGSLMAAAHSVSRRAASSVKAGRQMAMYSAPSSSGVP